MPQTIDLPKLPSPSSLATSTQVERHMPLVRRLARGYHHRSGVEFDDLVQVGSVGLLRAFRRFDPANGCSFEAYAATVISGEILHYLRDSAPLVRPPRELVELRSKVKAAASRLKQEVQREPSCEEIAVETGICPLKVSEILAMERATKPLSLDAEFDTDEDSAPMRMQLTDHKYGVFQNQTEDRIMLSQAIAKLKTTSREVIDFFFYQDLSQQEIGRLLGISQTQVSRRVRMALRELLGHLGVKTSVA